MATPQQLLDELHSVGVEVSDVWDMVNTRRTYPAAMPVLLDWLEHLDERMASAWEGEQLREGLVRALTVREARPAAASLLVSQMRRYRGQGDSGTAWAIGNALAVVADDSVYDDLKVLALDTDLGAARQMLAEALQRVSNPDATHTLIAMLADATVSGHAVAALAKRGDPTGIEALRPFADDPRAWVRKAARKALERTDARGR